MYIAKKKNLLVAASIITLYTNYNLAQVITNTTAQTINGQSYEVAFYDGDPSKLLPLNMFQPVKNTQSLTKNSGVIIDYDSTDTTLVSPIIVNGGILPNTVNIGIVENTFVELRNGAANNIIGADARADEDATAIGKAIISGGTVHFNAQGARAWVNNSINATTSATGILEISGGNINSNATAAWADSYIDNNTYNAKATAIGYVNMSDGQIAGNLTAASAEARQPDHDNGRGDLTAKATGHIVISGGTINGSVLAANANASIAGNSNLQSGRSSAIANNSSITLRNYITFAPTSEIAGGKIWCYQSSWSQVSYDSFTGNTLNMHAAPINIARVSNFEYYNFYLNPNNDSTINNNATAIITSNGMTNDRIVQYDGSLTNKHIVNQSNIALKAIDKNTTIGTGDTVVLLHINGGVGSLYLDGMGAPYTFKDFFKLNANGTLDSTIADYGLVKQAEVSYQIDDINNKVTATIESISMSTAAPQKLKPLSESRVASLMELNSAANLIADDLLSQVPNLANSGTLTPFMLVMGNHDRYNSGSHIDSTGSNLLLGSAYQVNNALALGAFIEYGKGNYDTYNRFNSGSNNGDGHATHYGLGLISRYTANNAYLEGAIRTGRAKNEYKNSHIRAFNGERLNYKHTTNYWGGHIATGYVTKLNAKTSLDSSIKYLYTSLNSHNTHFDGSKIEFERSYSSRMQAGTRLNYQYHPRLSFIVGAGYEYEFSNRPKVKVDDVHIKNASMKGSSGMLDLGVKLNPISNNDRASLEFIAKGYIGKRQGVAGNIRFEYKL